MASALLNGTLLVWNSSLLSDAAAFASDSSSSHQIPITVEPPGIYDFSFGMLLGTCLDYKANLH